MNVKPGEKTEARRLRQDLGLSMSEISTRLGVSRGSVSKWVRDIILKEEFKCRLVNNSREAASSPEQSERKSLFYRSARMRYQDQGRIDAKSKDPLHIAGCMLYWGEGEKGRNNVSFSNCDFHCIKLFKEFLVTCYGVQPEKLWLRINLCEDQKDSCGTVLSRWVKEVELPIEASRKVYLCKSNSIVSTRILPFGTAMLRVFSTELLHRIYGAICEYSGQNNYKWLY